VGGLIGHCVSPQPWREIDAHGKTETPQKGTQRPVVHPVSMSPKT